MKNKKIVKTFSIKDLHLRNELHFDACRNTNVAYIAKNKKKIIPRKQKYKGVGC